METIQINNIQVPIVRKEKELFGRSTRRCEYNFINDGIGEVLNIKSEYTYRNYYYYNLYDVKGNFLKEDFSFSVEHTKEWLSVKSMDSYKNIILYLNGDFRLLSVENCSINTMSEVDRFHDILSSKYKCHFSPRIDYKLREKYDLMPFYTIICGHSRAIEGILSREDISMTYKELKLKIDQAKEKFSKYIDYDIDKDFDQMERELIYSISKYLMITPQQYKNGRFSLVNKLIQRMNHNINNKK